MNRRRQSLFSRLIDGLDYAWRVALSWLLWPIYSTFDVLHALFGDTVSRLGSRSWTQLLIDTLLLVPRWIAFVFVWLFQAMLSWPRMMRLRDLASGLPALLAAAAAAAVLFFFTQDETTVLQAYQDKSNDAYSKATEETDLAAREKQLKLAQFYSRALLKIKPNDQHYRYIVAFLYQDLGEPARAQAIMDDLAPRDDLGYAKAHLWQANQLMGPDRPVTNDTLKAAEAHLIFALAAKTDTEEVHRLLGELYYYRWRRYNSQSRDPWEPSQATYLAKAEEHLSQLATLDTELALKLAEIHLLQGRVQQAELDVQEAVTRLTARLEALPGDVDARLQLADAYRLIRKYTEAVNVLREGRNLKPDVRFDQKLSSVYFHLANDFRLSKPNSLPEQFAALQDAYRAYPTNNFVAHRLIQALTSNSPEEVEAARAALLNLVDTRANGRLAALLLVYDFNRRTLPAKADDYMRILRAMPSDDTPAVIAGLMSAVLSSQVRTINPNAVSALFEVTLRVWPDDPDLLAARSQRYLIAQNFSAALGDLLKALERRPRDARLHEMVSATYRQLGLTDQANKHKQRAAELRVNVTQAAP